MDVMIVASDLLTALSLEATLDLGGHRVVARAGNAAAALEHAGRTRPALALVHLSARQSVGLVSELRYRFAVPSLLIGAAADCAAAHRAVAWGLIREPCGSRLILRAVMVAGRLREGRWPRGRLPRQLEFYHRPDRPVRPARRNAAPRAPSVVSIAPGRLSSCRWSASRSTAASRRSFGWRWRRTFASLWSRRSRSRRPIISTS